MTIKTQNDYRRESITKGDWVAPEDVSRHRIADHLISAYRALAGEVEKASARLPKKREEAREARAEADAAERDASRLENGARMLEERVDDLIQRMEDMEGTR